MNHSTSDDSERGSEGCPLKPISTMADLQAKAYETRVRERLMVKYPTLTLAEARQLEKQIQKLVQIYAEGRILLQGDPSDRILRDLRLQGEEQTRTDEQE